MAQLMIYNLRAATAFTLLSSLLFGVLRVYKILPDDESTVVLGYSVFFFVITFWQRIRAAGPKNGQPANKEQLTISFQSVGPKQSLRFGS